MVDTQAIRTTRPTAPPDVAICDHEGCGAIATHTYTWAWGESGACCSRHQVEKTQLSGTLKRTVTFTVINPGAQPPLQRDQRTRLQAEILVLKEELAESKAAGVSLYEQVKTLSGHVQRLTLLDRESRAQARDAIAMYEESRTNLEERETQLGEAVSEIGRLKAILPRAADDPSS